MGVEQQYEIKKRLWKISFKLNSNLVAFVFSNTFEFIMDSLAIYLEMCLSFSHNYISTSATEFLVTAMDVIYVSMYFQWNFLSYSLSQISTLLDNIRCSTEKFTNAMDTTNQTRGELIVV